MIDKIDLKYVVTGTGRCGTLFFANLLTSMNIPCSHEAIFTPNGLSWAKDIIEGKRKTRNSEISEIVEQPCNGINSILAESSYMAAPFLGDFDVDVIHLVRNPIDVISSFIGKAFNFFIDSKPTHNPDLPNNILYEKFIFEKIPELSNELTQIDRACLYYIRWNQLIEDSKKTKVLIKIEDGPQKIKDFFNFSGNCYNNNKCNSFKQHSLNWSFSQIKNPKIKKQMIDITKKYQYNSIKFF